MASRRYIDKSDESTRSNVSSSLERHTRVAQLFIRAEDLNSAEYSVVLNRSLSLKSVISTTSSFFGRFQQVRFQPHIQQINQIGSGLQGAVFEIVGRTYVFKKETPGNELLSSNLQSEYKIHCDVFDAFELYKTSTQNIVHVPKPQSFIPRYQEEATFWTEILPKIPKEYRIHEDVVTMERILPLPKVVRKALIAFFCRREWDLDDTEVECLLNEPENKHCLARVYLGKNEGSLHRENPAPLRNLPLYLDWLQEMGIETAILAQEMGKAYATMHWGAAVDGDDVEFVLGTSTIKGPEMPVESANIQHRAIGLYLLDFGQCEAVDLTVDSETVYQAFKGAMVLGDNQLFIPHASTSPQLFAAFRKGYVDAGNVIISARKLKKKFNMDDFMSEYEEYAQDFVY